MRLPIKVERLCGWHGIEFSKSGYIALGYWLVCFGRAGKRGLK